MTKPVTSLSGAYDNAKTRFITLAYTFLAKGHEVWREEKDPELKMRIAAIVAELETFLIDLDEGFDTAWKDQAKQPGASLKDIEAIAEMLQVQGRELEVVIDEAWPIKDDLKAFLNELDTVGKIIHRHLNPVS